MPLLKVRINWKWPNFMGRESFNFVFLLLLRHGVFFSCFECSLFSLSSIGPYLPGLRFLIAFSYCKWWLSGGNNEKEREGERERERERERQSKIQSTKWRNEAVAVGRVEWIVTYIHKVRDEERRKRKGKNRSRHKVSSSLEWATFNCRFVWFWAFLWLDSLPLSPFHHAFYFLLKSKSKKRKGKEREREREREKKSYTGYYWPRFVQLCTPGRLIFCFFSLLSDGSCICISSRSKTNSGVLFVCVTWDAFNH